MTNFCKIMVHLFFPTTDLSRTGSGGQIHGMPCRELMELPDHIVILPGLSVCDSQAKVNQLLSIPKKISGLFVRWHPFFSNSMFIGPDDPAHPFVPDDYPAVSFQDQVPVPGQ